MLRTLLLSLLNRSDELSVQRAGIVIDNTGYPSVIPRLRIATTVAWLSGKRIPHDPDQSPDELLFSVRLTAEECAVCT
jgi:hypothetical protein